MAQTVTVVATQDFSYEGRPVHAGEAITMRPIDAAIAGRRGQVSLDKQARATYQTKDLTATPVALLVALPVPLPEPPAPLPTAKRTRTSRSAKRRQAVSA